MEADALTPALWNAIADAISRALPGRNMSFGRVIKRDVTDKVVWLEEFGETAIPLCAFDSSFAYYDTQQDGTVKRREDKGDTDAAFRTKMLVPKVGQLVVIIDLFGNRRFPVCVGVLQSKLGSYWQGES